MNREWKEFDEEEALCHGKPPGDEADGRITTGEKRNSMHAGVYGMLKLSQQFGNKLQERSLIEIWLLTLWLDSDTCIKPNIKAKKPHT